MSIPHGIYFWHLDKLNFDYLAALKKANCKRVYLKTLDDASAGIFWKDQCTKKNIEKFNLFGIEVVAWGYVFDKRKTTDVAGIVDAVKKSIECGCIGFVVDIEAEVEDRSTHTQVEELMKGIRTVVPEGQLGYTSFGNPASHASVPYEILQKYCDYQQPQMYYKLWTFDVNESEVVKAFQQHINMGLNEKPIYPIFTAEQNADPKELQKFLDKYEGSSVYAAQCPTAWEIDYHADPAPKPIPTENGKIVRWIINQNDASDVRGVDANNKVVCWLDGGANFETSYYNALAAGNGKAKFSIESLPKKPSTTPPPFPIPPAKTDAERFVDYYKNNYMAVRALVESWFTPQHSPTAEKNGCAAHCRSALCLAGFPNPDPKTETLAAINADKFYAWLKTNGYKKITDVAKLLPGDICFSGTETDLTHVYVFNKYINSDVAEVLDNQKVGLHPRSLSGVGCGRFVSALRFP
jgi:hypothetical protein